MTYGKIPEAIVLIPSINFCWYIYDDKRYYYVEFVWLRWFVSTIKEFKWEED